MPSRGVIALIGDIRDRAHRFIQQELDARGMKGLAPSHGAILSALFRGREIGMAELADEIRRDKSTVTALVRKLEEHGYVTRRRDAHDGRVVHVALTRKGRAFQPAFREISEALLERTFRGFAGQEKEELIVHLTRILANWERG